MSRTLQFKRLANTHLGQIVGANGEIIVDYTNDTLTVHDGQTLGGSRLATEKYTNTAIVMANSAFLQANAANVLARAAFDSANINYAFTQTLATNITLAYNQANTATVLANAAFSFANTLSAASVDTLARTIANTATNNIVILQGVDATQNVRLDYSNAAITIIEGTNTNQNSRMTIIEGNNASQNVRLDYSNTAITIIQGTDTSQNARMTIIEGGNASQNVRLDYSNTAITIIQGTDTSQNSRMTIIEGTDATQNTNITAAAQTVPQNAQSANYTIQLTDAGKHIYYTQSTNTILYIPTTSNVAFSNGSTIMIISRTSSSANVTVSPNTGVSMYLAGNTTSASRNVTTYGMASLIQVAANTWFINGTGVS
jgi:hypothetical protein